MLCLLEGNSYNGCTSLKGAAAFHRPNVGLDLAPFLALLDRCGENHSSKHLLSLPLVPFPSGVVQSRSALLGSLWYWQCPAK